MPNWQDLGDCPVTDLDDLIGRIDAAGRLIGSYDPALMGMREMQECQLATLGCLAALAQILNRPDPPTEQTEAG